MLRDGAVEAVPTPLLAHVRAMRAVGAALAVGPAGSARAQDVGDGRGFRIVDVGQVRREWAGAAAREVAVRAPELVAEGVALLGHGVHGSTGGLGSRARVGVGAG